MTKAKYILTPVSKIKKLFCPACYFFVQAQDINLILGCILNHAKACKHRLAVKVLKGEPLKTSLMIPKM
jgi:hypothetical protein